MQNIRLTDFQEQTDAAELSRQQQYLARAGMHAQELAQQLGRRPTFHVTNFGCQMNARDAEKLAGILTAAGFDEIDTEDADFVIYNTCTVRDNADQHFFGRLGRASHFKKTQPWMKIAVCGCMMQEPANVEKIRKSYPYVDLVFGTHNLFRFPEYLCDVYEKDARLYDIWEKTDRMVEDLPVKRRYPYKSGLNIMFGCNNFCSYCIVPYVRGRERSRQPQDILREAERLAADGVTEIMLLGQNVNSYGNDLNGKCSFAELLEGVAHVPGIRRVRFMTPHPKDLSDDVIEVIKRNANIARHVHLPLQSGSDRILRKMNRRYTKQQFIDLALKIRREIPDVAITTDIIAGFPGEEPCDVDDTLDVIEKVHFDNAYTFVYSMRSGTPAARMPQVPEAQKKENFDRILAAVQRCARDQTLRQKGQISEALIEEINTQKEGYVTGRLSNNMIVHVPGDASMVGHFYPVKLEECMGFYYFGHIVQPDRTDAINDGKA